MPGLLLFTFRFVRFINHDRPDRYIRHINGYENYHTQGACS